MNEKIKKALGEQAEAVEKLLKESGIELGITNDGSLVPANKYDSMKSDVEKLQTDLEEKTKSAESVSTEKQTLADQLEKVKADMQKQFDDYKDNVSKQEVTRQRKQSLQAKLQEEKFDPRVMKHYMKAVDIDKVDFTDDGKVSDEWINSFKESEPDSFGKTKVDSEKSIGKDKEKKGKFYSSEDVDKMSQEEVNANYKDIRTSMREW